MTTKRKQTRGRTLHIIGGLLITSAIFRMLDGTGQAMAEADTPNAEPVAEATAMQDEVEPDIDTLLGAIKAREMALDAREAELMARIEALDIVEAEVTEQLVALEAAEKTLRETIALADAAAETDLGRLTTVYENMKPKDAAALFEEMAPEFSAGFLGMMNPEPAALIMSLLEPQTAHAISVVLAGRNVGVPTQ